MRELLIVGVGSFIGGGGRFYLSTIVSDTLQYQRLPIGTLTVNFLGCFLVGMMAGVLEHHHLGSQTLRLFLVTGLLGGFTTFSAFGYETVILLQAHNFKFAFLNIILSVTTCLFAVWVGLKLAEYL